MKNLIIAFILGFITISAGTSGDTEILNEVDKSMTGPKAVYMKISIEISKNGKITDSKSVEMYEMGGTKRLGRFLSPKEDKGLAFLSDGNSMLMYLPAYKKVKNINSASKSGKFANTDFSYEDMEKRRYQDCWTCTVEKEDEKTYILNLFPKEGCETQYSKLRMIVDKTNWFPIHTEYFNGKGEYVKSLDSDSIVNVSGYLFSSKSVMKDIKSGRMSVMRMSDINAEIKLPDGFFSERTLAK